MELREKMELALQQSGLPAGRAVDNATFLGEGAHNNAYLLPLDDGRRMVLRLPKAVNAYDTVVEYDETELITDYAGTELYYRLANQVRPGICPEEFYFHVSPALSYTLETYVGEVPRVHDLTPELAYSIGRQRGEFMREMDKLDPGLEGYAFLKWDGARLVGQMQGDFRDNLRDEENDYRQDFENLQKADLSFDRRLVESKLNEIFANRTIDSETLSLTNRDTSPENTVVVNGRLHIIDPYPILYAGKVFAGNTLNNINTLYPLELAYPRYAKHQWHTCTANIFRLGEGFLDGYSQNDPDRRRAVRYEEYLMLHAIVTGHLDLLQNEGDLSTRQIRQSGDKDLLAKRLPHLLRRLETFSFA